MTTASPPRRTDPGAFTRSEVRRPASLADAVRELTELGADGAPLAGGTWVMRAPLHGAPVARVYVALDGLAELRGFRATDDAVEIGAAVTHDELAALDCPAALAGLVEAARRSAFPAVRSVATVGGNIAADGFPEADLVPALLAADAHVVLAGDGDTVSAARVAVGGVEEVARLSPAAAAALVGNPLDDATAERAGQAAADECTAREGLDAPGWYRLAVLPALARRAAAALTTSDDEQN